MNDLSGNPLMNITTELRFAEFKPSHVVPAITTLIERAEEQMAALQQNIEPGWDGLMGALEEIWSPVWSAWGMVCHLNAVKNSDELRAAYEEVQPRVVEASLKSSQSRPVYDAMVALRDSDEFETLEPARRRVLEKEIKAAELSGVGLDGAAKERFNEIANTQSKLKTNFTNHVLDATKAFELVITDPADTEGWPSTFRSMASQSYNGKFPEQAGDAEKGPWRVTLDGPSAGPFLRNSRNRAQREALYLALITRASEGELDNRGLIVELLKLRTEQAALLGFKNYAELSLATKMAPDVAAVRAMAGELEAASRPGAEKDLAEVKAFAAEHGAPEETEHWDVGFWVERLREERFSYTDEQVRPYFPLDQVLSGLFELCGWLFDVEFREDTQSVQVWHPDVRYYRVSNADGKEISSFYLDPYSRPAEKQGGAWMNTGLQRKRIGEDIRNPIIYLVCNGTPPVGDVPSLMSFGEVVTLYHEFGHGLHGMLTTVEEPGVAGNRGVEWDAVELPSQFMENWCYQKKTLKEMARHYETGEPMPDELVDKILATRQFRAGTAMLGQLAYLNVDLELYDGYDPEGDESPLALQQRVFERVQVAPPHPRNSFLCSFNHIFSGGYAAGYFCYKWAEVLSADAFAAFEEVGLEDGEAVAKAGMRFRETVLSLGGSIHPMELYKMFRGREPKTDAVLRHNGLA
jgi:oligopeptidase A